MPVSGPFHGRSLQRADGNGGGAAGRWMGNASGSTECQDPDFELGNTADFPVACLPTELSGLLTEVQMWT